jgi:hypothetical protein
MFYIMLTGWPPGPPALQRVFSINAVIELSPDERRVENSMDTVGLHALLYFASHSSRLHPSLCLPATAPQRASEAMPLRLAENGVRCFAGTCYLDSRWIPANDSLDRILVFYCRIMILSAQLGDSGTWTRGRPSRPPPWHPGTRVLVC